jgi:hypothetical protein
LELERHLYGAIRRANGKTYNVGLIPKLKMATPFLVLKTLTGFDFQFTKV